MNSHVMTMPADRVPSGSLLPFPPIDEDREDDAEVREGAVPPAAAERPRSLFERLLDTIRRPVDPNFDNP